MTMWIILLTLRLTLSLVTFPPFTTSQIMSDQGKCLNFWLRQELKESQTCLELPVFIFLAQISKLLSQVSGSNFVSALFCLSLIYLSLWVLSSNLTSTFILDLLPSFTNTLMNVSVPIERDVTFTCNVKNIGHYRVGGVLIIR